MSEERKFLHDVANPLGTAMFVLDSVVEDLAEASEPNADAIRQLNQVKTALEKVKALLQERRMKLINEDEKNG